MIDLIKKTLLAGVGAAIVTKEKAEHALQDYVKQGKVSAADARAMAERIAELAASRDRVSEMGLRAHSFVLQRHSIRDYVDWFEGLVQEAWQRSPRTWPDDRPLMPPRRCGAPPPTPITLWGRCIRFSGKVRRRLGRAERSAAEGE